LANRQISRKAERNALLPTLSLVGFYGGSGLAGLVPPGNKANSTVPTDLTGAWQMPSTIHRRTIMSDST
jgi:outer membrane protein TolC